MKNKLTDLNDHLFAQLERLGEEDLTPAQMELEAERTKSITAIAHQIVANAKVQLEAIQTIKGGELPQSGNDMIGTTFFTAQPEGNEKKRLNNG